MTDTGKPLPSGGWSEEILTLDSATVVPPETSDFVQEAGILDADGSYCAQGALWRKHRPLTVAPAVPAGPAEELPGRWLWGGVLWSHFGHFLAESTARLWALDHLDAPVDGVLFIPKRPRKGDQFKPFHQPFFDAAGLTAPVKVAAAPLRVEQLVVPGQGFGLGEISAGTEAFRASRMARLGAHIQAQGGARLYISRSKLGYSRGSILGETLVEDHLAAEGYEIFHPQEHSIPDQIARYKAAREIVATDGSALHLAAMVGRRDQRYAVIARRNSTAVDLLLRHVEHFTGRAPVHLLRLRLTRYPKNRGKAGKRLALGELNLTAIGAGLAEAGFIGRADGWRNLTEQEVEAELAATGTEWEIPRWQQRQMQRGKAGAA